MLALNGGAKKATEEDGRTTAEARFVTRLDASGDTDPVNMRMPFVIADSGNNRVLLWDLAP